MVKEIGRLHGACAGRNDRRHHAPGGNALPLSVTLDGACVWGTNPPSELGVRDAVMDKVTGKSHADEISHPAYSKQSPELLSLALTFIVHCSGRPNG